METIEAILLPIDENILALSQLKAPIVSVGAGCEGNGSNFLTGI